MQQLSTMDNAFVLQESQRTPMHISPVLIYDQSHRERGKVRFKEILTVFERNLHKSPVFRRKLLSRTMGFDNPYWVEDDHFDLEFHVRHIALPTPGDWRQFCILLSRLHSRGLDMNRPLWEAYVIEGLNNVEGFPDNSFAVMLKIHHSAIDGVSGAEIISAINSLTEEVEPPLVPDPWQPEKPPRDWYFWSQAMRNNMNLPMRFIDTARTLVPAAIKATQQSQEHPEHKGGRLRTRFNGEASSYRVTDALLLDLNEVKAIKSAIEGCTVNDVMVSIVGGGLRKYLQAHDELPEESLTCGAPISVRPKNESSSGGNQISMMTISLCSDVEKPMERLRAVMDSAHEGKAYSSALGAHAMMDITESLAPQVIGLGMRAAFSAAIATDMQLPLQTIVSNVPGPQVPLFMAGAKLHATMGLGPVVDNMGLFNAVLSAAGKICINFVACRNMLPDPDLYKRCLEESYAELSKAAKRSLASQKKSASSKKTTASKASTKTNRKSARSRKAS